MIDNSYNKCKQEVNNYYKIENKGRLRIFFGYANCVGKTYTMLQAVHIEKNSGLDVVIGYIESYTSQKTKSLLKGLEVLPVLKECDEFDIDTALKRKPKVIVIDNIAHTNSPICRHTKRYNDIDELLNAGIDVYTTMNVQDLESLNDTIYSIMHVVIQDRIPDSIFDNADQVELVDIEPDNLIKRLNENLIYKQGKFSNIFDSLIIKENLTALREIALRKLADKINKEIRINKNISVDNKYFTSEHILVCLSSSPSNVKTIRTAGEVVTALNAHFTALYIETLNKPQTNKDIEQLKNNLKLAEQVGARIVTIYGNNIAKQISEYAKVSGISKVILGRTSRKFKIMRFNENIADKLMVLSPNLDIYIIPDNVVTNKKVISNIKFPIFNMIDILKMFMILLVCSLIGIMFYDFNLLDSNIIIVYILGVLLVSISTKDHIYGIFASVISVLSFNFLFTYPRYSFTTNDMEYPITFLIMLLASLITSTLTKCVKNQAKMAAIKAYRTEALFETSQELSKAENLDDIILKSLNQLKKILNKPIIVYISDKENFFVPTILKEEFKDSIKKFNSKDENKIISWVFSNKKPAGATTETFQNSNILYLPISTENSIFAVLGILLEDSKIIEPFDYSLLMAIINQMSFVIEKIYLNESKREAQLRVEKERFRSNLLRSISHDLRTPLTSISGNASILLSNEIDIPRKDKRKILEDIYDDSLWLIGLVENLLYITRIDNGNMQINLQPEFIIEIVSEAILHVNKGKNEHNITIKNDDEFLMSKVDARLIIQVIINIIDNAIKYTHVNSNIIIHSYRNNNNAIIEISDDGKGIKDEDKKQIFNMFFTADNKKGDSRRGLGIGLALCKSIIDAHNGKLYVSDNKPKGTIFTIVLNAEKVDIQ